MYQMLSSSLVLSRKNYQARNHYLLDFCVDFCGRYIFRQRRKGYLSYATLEGRELFSTLRQNSIDNIRSIMMSISDFEIYVEDSELFWTVALNLYPTSDKFITFHFGVDYRICTQKDIEYLAMSLVELSKTMKAASGFIDINCIYPIGMTAAEEELELSTIQLLYNNLDKLVRGCFWGNFIDNELVEKIGGKDAAKKLCPSYIVSEVDGGGLYIQNKGPLGSSINQDELISLFKPILL